MRQTLTKLAAWARGLARLALGRTRARSPRAQVDAVAVRNVDDGDPEARFSKAWYERLYQDLGDGISCFRPDAERDYGGGALPACRCCPADLRLHLLPGEERCFEDVVNSHDFQLVDHPNLDGRKTIICSKRGLCGGRKPYVCRTHPLHFAEGLVMFEEGLCRLRATTFLAMHQEQVERVRAVALAQGLDEVPLGYGRVRGAAGGPSHVDFER